MAYTTRLMLQRKDEDGGSLRLPIAIRAERTDRLGFAVDADGLVIDSATVILTIHKSYGITTGDRIIDDDREYTVQSIVPNKKSPTQFVDVRCK